jgi:cyanophycinase-like exopeptidase
MTEVAESAELDRPIPKGLRVALALYLCLRLPLVIGVGLLCNQELVLFGCTSTESLVAPRVAVDAAIDAALLCDCGSVDANPPPLSGAVTVYPRRGALDDDEALPAGPGVVLDGGFEGDVVRRWIHSHVANSVAAHADVVVLTANDTDASGGWLEAAAFHSVQTFRIGDGATLGDLAWVGERIAHAEVVWFTGGDQAKYVRWKGTPIAAAVNASYARGGIVGGASAGMIVLGEFVNDATLTLSENLTTPLLVANPYDARLHFTRDVFSLGLLRGVITDPHFSARDRLGRLSAFMARQVADGNTQEVLGVGVDDGAALAIDALGVGVRLANSPASSVFVLRGGAASQVVDGKPLQYPNLELVKLAEDGDSYNVALRCGTGKYKRLSVDGSFVPPYGMDAYANGPQLNTCK